ncbi:MAG: hypothetical protein HYU88_13445 [Chloroflexi bacterium]|nr:hypothetical protein [Chloroflexota bacterium]
MASEKAQESQQQTTRPLSKGPRKRAGGNNGNGKRFPPGQNSHTGEVFRRGPDLIARGSVKLLYSQILLDEREELYRQTVRGIGDPRYAMEFLERAADRIEGRPKQTIVASVSRTTVFGPDDRAAEPQPVREGASAPAPDPVQRVVNEAIAARPSPRTMLLGLDVSEPETPASPARR